MANGGYLGIDESNHGRTPEVLIAVHSERRRDTYKHKEHDLLPKHRQRGEKSVTRALGGRTYKHILFPGDYINLIGKNNVGIVAISEFIKHFNEVCNDDLDKILVDGELKSTQMELLERILHPIKLPSLVSMSRADRIFEIVNVADHVANILYRHYARSKPNGDQSWKYVENMLSFDITTYAKLLRA